MFEGDVQNPQKGTFTNPCGITVIFSKIRVELAPKFQASQVAWQRDLCETLAEAITESQAFQTAWEGHSFQALVESVTWLTQLRLGSSTSKM